MKTKNFFAIISIVTIYQLYYPGRRQRGTGQSGYFKNLQEANKLITNDLDI